MVIIDAGHGGSDPGASSKDIVEKDYTLKISNYMYDRFNELGIPTFISRTEDITLNPSDRINKIKPNITSSDDIVISNHLNAGGGDGAEVIYALRNNDILSKMILNNIEETGQNVRKWYQRKLPSDPSNDYYYIIRNTKPAESVLIEYGFLDSAKDDKQQIKNDWMKWAEAVVKAVAEYKNYNYVEPGMNNTVNDVYVVRNGDSLWSIAKKFNVSVDKLKKINNLNSNLIRVGQKLVIPGFPPTNQTNTSYIVQKGDTLYSIANSNGTTVDELTNLNDLVNTQIYVGQVLQIPETYEVVTDNNTYVVQKGDTLSLIANKFNTTPQKIISKNGLNSDILIGGEILLIPLEVESTGSNEDFNLGSDIYIVKKGDTLYSIANKYEVSVNDLKDINNLTTNILSIGQALTIPKSPTSIKNNMYMVEKGDTLWGISKRFGVSINDIRSINNLTSDILNIGQVLIIP